MPDDVITGPFDRLGKFKTFGYYAIYGYVKVEPFGRKYIEQHVVGRYTPHVVNAMWIEPMHAVCGGCEAEMTVLGRSPEECPNCGCPWKAYATLKEEK